MTEHKFKVGDEVFVSGHNLHKSVVEKITPTGRVKVRGFDQQFRQDGQHCGLENLHNRGMILLQSSPHLVEQWLDQQFHSHARSLLKKLFNAKKLAVAPDQRPEFIKQLNSLIDKTNQSAA